MTERFVSANLDLSRLPAPDAILDVDYEVIRAERIARLKVLWPDLDTESIETEPGVVLEESGAYREMLAKAAINDGVRAVMLATSSGADLDGMAVFYGVQRLVLRAATNDLPVLMEPDSDFRLRIQLAPEQLPYAGMTGGGYRALALRLAPSVKDVSTVKRDGGRVDVILLGRDGNGAVSDEVVTTVYAAFQDDDATQLTDVVTVRSATIVTYAPTITLRIPRGPDANVVRAAAEAAVRAYAASRHRVGKTVFANMLEAAAAVGGVENASVNIADVVPGDDGAAYMTALTFVTQVIG